MTLTHATAVRNAQADAVDDAVNTGTGTAQFIARASTTVLVAFNLPNPAFAAASGGDLVLNSTPIAGTGVAAGAADNFLLVDRDAGTVLSGSISGPGGGGDVEASNINIAVDQDCSLESFTYTAAA
jgi:hypothetical protein